VTELEALDGVPLQVLLEQRTARYRGIGVFTG
jgi:hypothetical protein